MKNQFCNTCHLTMEIPTFVSNEILGVGQLYKLLFRYQQMRANYDLTYAEWQKVFTEDLKPYKGYTDTTSITIPITHPYFAAEITKLHKGAIGVDLPTWFNIQDNNKHIMLVAQDPLRSSKWYGYCYDAVLSSPFGQHDFEHRQKENGGKIMDLIIEKLVNNGFGIYLTDANKFFVYDHETTDEFSINQAEVYSGIMMKEIELVKPALIVAIGRIAERMCRTMGLSSVLALPHTSGMARGAVIRRFPELDKLGATAENIACEYANIITDRINN